MDEEAKKTFMATLKSLRMFTDEEIEDIVNAEVPEEVRE